MSFPMAMRDYFGNRPGHDKASEFMAELKALTDEDKADFRTMLVGVGYVLK